MPSSSNPQVTLIDDPHCSETFATGVSGFAFVGSNIVITFDCARVDHSTAPGPITRVVCQRLVVPVETAQSLVVNLNDFLVKRGHDPSRKVQGNVTSQ
jgi:hypothetical protein